MSSQEFTAWLAYDAVEPIGARHDDVLAALLGSILINLQLDPAKSAPVETADLVPNWWALPEAVVPNGPLAETDLMNLMSMVESYNAAYGGADLRAV